MASSRGIVTLLRSVPGVTAAVGLAVGASLAVASCAGARTSERAAGAASAKHPEVDSGLDTCSGCHERATPQVATQWRDSRHGMSLVQCFVCHGSTGADFQARPQPAGCAGCHALQSVASTAACFTCHPAHALRAQGKPMPHPPKPQEAAR